MKNGSNRRVRLFLCVLMLSILTVPSWGFAADEEGCLICHKYPGLARIDQKTGKLRLFYVNDGMYKNSVHGKVLCRNCHLKLDVIPHADFKKVDCSTKCHIKEPSTDKEFSHGNILDEFNQSVHGRGTPENPKKYVEDMPKCPDCHVNAIYKPMTGIMGEEGISRDSLRRCIDCHPNKDWATRFYQHFTHRLHRSRTALETVELCLVCHKNEQMMARHGLIATSNYRDSFHWKGVLYGDPHAPDCLSCHAPVGYKVHSMQTMTDPRSAVHPKNLQQTCANTEGTQICHPNAIASFAEGKIHQTGLGFEDTVSAFVKGEEPLDEIAELRKERRFRNIMAEDDTDFEHMTENEKFQRKVYIIVKYVYTMLITVVIGGMLIHQILDFFRTVQNRKNH